MSTDTRIDGRYPGGARPGPALTFAEVSKVNLSRCARWHPGGIEDWSVSDWAIAMGGEAGEVLNAIKKLRRVEERIASANEDQPADREAAVAAVASELGDTFIYLDLLAQRLGLRLEECVRDTFNRISARERFPERLEVVSQASNEEELQRTIVEATLRVSWVLDTLKSRKRGLNQLPGHGGTEATCDICNMIPRLTEALEWLTSFPAPDHDREIALAQADGQDR